MIAEDYGFAEALEERTLADELDTIRVVEQHIAGLQAECLYISGTHRHTCRQGPVQTPRGRYVVHAELDDTAWVAFAGREAGLGLPDHIAESCPAPA
ncbi:MAG: hypothetical protein A2W08_03470 [Candidatus Rokubacteria bacterium RBG_16_73_20]|nr:MAG: hypothetical protein A2W08_03470 [Candidatus Rokubacteria bacterium RBG_16_73_20]